MQQSHLEKKNKTNDKTHGNLTFLNHRNMKDKSGASLKQKLSPSSIPNKDLLPLDQNQPLEKKKGRPCTRNDCLFQQVSSETYNFSGKTEIKKEHCQKASEFRF